MARDLTKRQRAILEFLIASIRDNGLPPTIAEIGGEFGISSTNAVNDHLVALEKKGFIERSSKARGIRITGKAAVGLYAQQAGMAPLVGRVAAGYPLLAEENIEEYVPVTPSQASRGAFCLRVSGDSMIDAGIFEGDVLVVDPGRRPNSGDIVVALVDSDEATVKYFYPRGDVIEFRPANADYPPMLFPAHAVALQGVVIGLQRSLM